MSNERKIYKPGPVRGFPEWLPEERLIEQKWFDNIRRVFESYGFCNIETPSVEELDVLAAKGEVDKEIYVIERLHKDENDKKEARLALHFDQTVPMARYVAMNFNNLVFPFKRYQMQRVWRGERPQMGRMREFYQCDIDVINVDNLPISFDAEVASMMYEVLESLNIGRVRLRISNRKILMGYLSSLSNVDNDYIVKVLASVDKYEKQGEEFVRNSIIELGLRLEYGKEIATEILNLVNTKDISLIESKNDLMKEGIDELSFVLKNLEHLKDNVIADLSIVRGLDYYTGTVYETQLLDVPEFTGSVCSGGRYDDLAGSYINKHLPGVGISLGFSRLFDVIKQKRPDLMGLDDKSPKGPAHVMMMVPENETDRPLAHDTARQLRKRGINVEMYHAPKKFGDQLKYASKKNIPYVWVVRDGKHEVKDMNAQTQTQADPQTWTPPDRKVLDEVA
ncbi:MAG: histidine--tRNA ligase [Micavibrio aeruginosavorus]|uniref:Histidine--tRNA ligase n=1 Tax=Micavibrio aeruginosavorus TaxID=349221 RepID=A0A7T5R153_9BACT|nr:MAG: histidine--tRNA ligase [Micavibrio aeruginosavorus]